MHLWSRVAAFSSIQSVCSFSPPRAASFSSVTIFPPPALAPILLPSAAMEPPPPCHRGRHHRACHQVAAMVVHHLPPPLPPPRGHGPSLPRSHIRPSPSRGHGPSLPRSRRCYHTQGETKLGLFQLEKTYLREKTKLHFHHSQHSRYHLIGKYVTGGTAYFPPSDQAG